MMKRLLIARWSTRGGKHWTELFWNVDIESNEYYSYRENGAGGVMADPDGSALNAIHNIEERIRLFRIEDHPSLKMAFRHHVVDEWSKRHDAT
jgi:hypothetical protein